MTFLSARAHCLTRGKGWPSYLLMVKANMAACVCSGLAEVMAGLGVEKLDKLMPDVVQTASKVDIASHVRDGYIMMFIYLPLTFGDKFTPYVGPIIPCILKVNATPLVRLI